MPRYVALLRGINVGGNKKIAMADLRALLASDGYSDIATVLQSGNAVFSSPHAEPAQLAGAIEEAIRQQLGMSVRCLIRTGAEMQAVVAGNPLVERFGGGSKMMVHFLGERLGTEHLATFDPCALDPEHIALGDRAIYQWCPDGLLSAPAVGTFLDRLLKITVTARNWNTVTKLGQLTTET